MPSSGETRKLSIVVPCFNEEAQVRASLERVLAAPVPDGWEREVVLIDDASTDGTRAVLEALDLPVRVIYRETNGGKGTALIDGFAHVTGTHILIQDADLEYEPNEIPALLAALTTPTTVVYGSRNLRPNRKGGLGARAGVWLATALMNRLYGTKLTDTFTCYKLFPHDAAHLFMPGGFDAELRFTAALIRGGYRIVEVPISYAPRTKAEGKKIRYRHGFEAIWGLLKDYWETAKRPTRSSSGMIDAPHNPVDSR